MLMDNAMSERGSARLVSLALEQPSAPIRHSTAMHLKPSLVFVRLESKPSSHI
jgi:hypothetical protein